MTLSLMLIPIKCLVEKQTSFLIHECTGAERHICLYFTFSSTAPTLAGAALVRFSGFSVKTHILTAFLIMLLEIRSCNGRAVGAGVGGTKAFDPYEAAQTVFPTLIRPLQKYLRATRQQSRHPVDSVIDHLATCITFGLSPLTFLERFNPAASTPQQDAATAANALTVARNIAQRHRRPLIIAGGAMAGSGGGAEGGVEGAEYKPPGPPVAPGGQQVWQIVADRALSRDIADGLVFQLRRQHGNCEISLLCTVHRLPLLQLLEAGVGSGTPGAMA